MEIRELTLDDLERVWKLDDASGNSVGQWIEELEAGEKSDYAFGAFVDGELIGYCTIGYADDCADCIDKHPLHNSDSLLLSDVYVLPEYRHQEIATELISRAVELKMECEPDSKSIFLTLLYDSLGDFYKKLGFDWVDDTHKYAMIKELKEREYSELFGER